jgi:hypothetical protein
MTHKEILATIKKLGYKVSFAKKTTSVKELWISQIDGEKMYSEPSWSSRNKNWEFLERIIKEKRLKGL